MNTFLKLAAGAAAVLAVAIVGANLLGTSTGPGALPSPTSTDVRSPSPAATPATPEPTAVARPGELPPNGTILTADPYAFYGDANGRTVRIDFSGASGWMSREWFITTPDENAPQPALMAWGYGTIDRVTADPCHPDPATDSAGATVDDLVTALLAQGTRTSGPPIEVSISGYPGKQIDSTVDAGDVTNCGRGRLELWRLKDGKFRWAFESMVQRLIVLDVDGIRVLLEGSYPVGGPADQLLAIMDTIQITVE